MGVDDTVNIAAVEALKAENAIAVNRAVAAEKEVRMLHERLLQSEHDRSSERTEGWKREREERRRAL